jgi:hypothetical protein
MAELAGEAYVPDLVMEDSGKISWNPRAMISQRGTRLHFTMHAHVHGRIWKKKGRSLHLNYHMEKG